MKKILLLILDGWGVNSDPSYNAITRANPPYWNKLLEDYPSSILCAAGETVGLPKGGLSGSEVGHLAISAGRVVLQNSVKINRSIESRSFFGKEILNRIKNHTENFGSTLHLVGLLSDGGIHSDIEHLIALLDWAKNRNIRSVALHLILDGRDMLPMSANTLLKKLKPHLAENISISTICGRSIAMDRNENWERTVSAHTNMITSDVVRQIDPITYIENNYKEKVTDEFIQPATFTENIIKDNDAVFFFNFRSDRMRQLVRLFLGDAPSGIMQNIDVPKNLFITSMTEYSKKFSDVHVLFPSDITKNTLGEWISKKGLKQLRLAETEKYAHVTYFFNGGREEAYENETRLLIPSLGLKNYAMNPEMSIDEIKSTLLNALNQQSNDLIVCNIANGDMVGHSGNIDASIEAVKYIDNFLSEVIPKAHEHGYTCAITADHGNIESMKLNGLPHTSHTMNDVPFIVTLKNIKLKPKGELIQTAPTILELMEIKKPQEMQCTSLIE